MKKFIITKIILLVIVFFIGCNSSHYGFIANSLDKISGTSTEGIFQDELENIINENSGADNGDILQEETGAGESKRIIDEIDISGYRVIQGDRFINDWQVTHDLAVYFYRSDNMYFDTSAVSAWPACDPLTHTKTLWCCGNAWIVDFDTKTVRTWEWVRVNQKQRPLTNLLKESDVDGFKIKEGKEYGFFLSTPARNAIRTSNKRTKIVKVKYIKGTFEQNRDKIK